MYSIIVQALEEGEDLQELTERTREKKERRLNNKLLKEAEASARGTPVSDIDSRSRKSKKGKNKVDDAGAGSKRKRGHKSMSVTPSIADDEEDDHESVRALLFTR